jgi:predicted MFS family arabinose efflux permease
LIYFIICTPIGFLIGLIWGWDEAKLGATIGGLIAFLAVADMLKKK